TGVVAGHGRRAGQIQPEIQLVRAGPKVAARCHWLAEELEASARHSDGTDGRVGEGGKRSQANPTLDLRGRDQVSTVHQRLCRRGKPADHAHRGAGGQVPVGGHAYRGELVGRGVVGDAGQGRGGDVRAHRQGCRFRRGKRNGGNVR